jgi:Zn-dependent peptidase ImmA (M78 family)
MGFNHRELDLGDFHNICEDQGILVQYSHVCHGFYFNCLEKDVVVLPHSLTGHELAYTAFHELGHYFSGHQVGFCGLVDSKEEREADAVATVALMPLSRLQEGGVIDTTRFAYELLQKRIKLFFQYGLGLMLLIEVIDKVVY